MHSPDFQRFISSMNNAVGARPLATCVEINPKIDIAAFPAETSVGFIPMEAVSSNATGEYYAATVPLEQVSKNYTRFKDGDVLWAKITPSMQNGKACVVDSLPGGLGFGSTEFHVLRPRSEDVSARFVMEFLSQDTLRQFATHAFTGTAGQQRVPKSFLESLPFPALSLNRQHELVAAMDAARSERKAKLAEADELLAGLDDFVLHSLGISSPPADNRKVFAVRLGHIGNQERLDPNYYHPERINTLRLLENALAPVEIVSLAEMVEFIREQLPTPTETYLGLAHVQGHTGELGEAKETVSGACLAFQANDVLFARLRPYLNKVHRAEAGGSCSTEFHVLRIMDNNLLLPDYLATILRGKIVLAQTVHMVTGNTHPRLTNDDVVNLRFPIPHIGIQEIIRVEAVRRRDESRRLRAEAETVWQEAKGWFEKQMLGASYS